MNDRSCWLTTQSTRSDCLLPPDCLSRIGSPSRTHPQSAPESTRQTLPSCRSAPASAGVRRPPQVAPLALRAFALPHRLCTYIESHLALDAPILTQDVHANARSHSPPPTGPPLCTPVPSVLSF